jgi:hypothetical protein
VLTTAGCLAVTGGAGSAACVIAGFAVGGAVANALSCPPGQSIAGCAVRGAVAGAVGGAVFVATGGTGGGVSAAIIAGGLSSATTDAAEQVMSTGTIDPTEVIEQGVVGGATGGIFHGAGRLAAGLRSGSAGEGRVALSCTGNSFVAGTAVLLAGGAHKRIEDVEPGDKVVATDPTTGRTEARPVAEVIVGHGQKQLVEITVEGDGGAEGRGGGAEGRGGGAEGSAEGRGGGAASTVTASTVTAGSITATEGHPFWVADQHRWVDAKDLRPGNLLRTSAGTYVQVGAVRKFAQALTVYNLTVDGIHTYYASAGAQDLLVHNCAASVSRTVLLGRKGDIEDYIDAHPGGGFDADFLNMRGTMRRRGPARLGGTGARGSSPRARARGPGDATSASSTTRSRPATTSGWSPIRTRRCTRAAIPTRGS